jgi:diguanylate cyclase (GGDEF)-like protein/PAS domain S-box-containing protein
MENYVPKILVVDDAQKNLVAMQQILKALPIAPFFCKSGNEALALTLEHTFALILLDVMMPEMNGFEVAELLRLNELTKRIPIIFVTALGKEETHAFRGYEAGAVDYLLKPINPQILVSKVKVFIALDGYQRELEAREERYRLLVERAPDIIYTFSNKRGGIYFSSRVEAILGYSPQYLCENPWSWSESIHPDDITKVQYALQSFRLEGDFDLEYRIKNTREEWVWLHDRLISQRTEDEEIIVEGIATDITERKQSQETMEYLAKHDQLTGLANRGMYHDFQSKALSRARRYDRKMAVILLDLDHFKDVNDRLGHDVGDMLLKSVGERLKACIRSADLVARLGGDEFAIILDEITRVEDAATIARKILDSLALPHQLTGLELIISSSIGIAVYTGGAQTLDELNKHADIAMYGAKKAGRNTFQFFSPELHASVIERARLECDLREAIASDDFFVHYQPQVDISTGEIIGVEALLRWQHAKLGMISPSRFIPLAEESRIIASLGEWILQNVCRETELLRLSASKKLLFSISVNVSSLQLQQERFAETVKSILKTKAFPAHQLVIELTESTIMDNPEISTPVLTEIRELGVKIAIDDFGAGYSSLSYLKHLPIDALNIDISFIRDIGKDKNNDAIIKTIISLGNNLGLRVMAEGVETTAQAEFLRNNNCTLMQGYLFGDPMDHTEVCRLIRDGIKVNHDNI